MPQESVAQLTTPGGFGFLFAAARSPLGDGWDDLVGATDHVKPECCYWVACDSQTNIEGQPVKPI